MISIIYASSAINRIIIAKASEIILYLRVFLKPLLNITNFTRLFYLSPIESRAINFQRQGVFYPAFFLLAIRRLKNE